MTAIEIRRKILEMLFTIFKQHPYNRITPKEFRETLNISLSDLNYNIVYLEEKGLVELQKPLEGNIFVGARITSKGIDLLEDEEQIDILFPVKANPKSVPDYALRELSEILNAIGYDETLSDDAKDIIEDGITTIIEELKKTDSLPRRFKEPKN